MKNSAVIINAARKAALVMAVSVLALGLAGCDVWAAKSKDTVDDALLRAEMVEQRLTQAETLIHTVAVAKKEAESIDVSEAETSLVNASRKAFDPNAMQEKIRSALEEQNGTYEDAAAFEHAAAALAEGHRTVDKMYADKDEATGKKLQERLASPETKATIDDIVGRMASPALAAETSVTQQAINVSLTMEEKTLAPDHSPDVYKELKADLPNVLSELRKRSENEGAYSRDTARLGATTMLTFSLATLSDADLAAIQKFYASSYGEAKTKALVSAYAEVWSTSTVAMISAYIDELASAKSSAAKVQ